MKRLLVVCICILVISSITACAGSLGDIERSLGASIIQSEISPADYSRYSPYDSSAFFGMNFVQAETLLRDAGFDHIITVPVDDIDSSSNIVDGAVESVTINGLNEYTSKEQFNADSEVLITYHNIPKLPVPIDPLDAMNMPHMEVGKAFFDAGYMSIETDEIYDLPAGMNNQTIISANGQDITEKTQLPFDSKISILEHFPISEYLTTINIAFEPNLLFSKYNVTVTLDGEELGTLPHGENGIFEIRLPAGSYELVFSKDTDSEVASSVTLVVNSETSASYNISCNRKSVDIELIDLVHSLTDNNLMMPFCTSHYLRKDYQAVVKELKTLGFNNVTTEAVADTFWPPDMVNTVVGVDIGGKSEFAHDDLFDKTTAVTVFYHVADFAFDQTAVNVTEKDTFNLTYTLTSGDAIESISFEIDNPDVLKRNDDGSYTALVPGVAHVIASSGGNTYSECTVEVSEIIVPIERLEFSADEIFVSVGSTFKVDYTIIPANANYTEMRAEISNELIELGENDSFYSAEAGDSEISFYQDEKLLGTFTVHAEFVEIEVLNIEEATEEAFIGNTIDLPFHLVPENATNKGLSVTSSNPNIAEIVFDERGDSVVKVVGKAAGAATVTITTPNGVSCKQTITVKEVEPSVITLKNSQMDQRIEIGSPIALDISWEPENTSDKKLTWLSSNRNVIKVDAEGNLEAVGVGTAEITARHKSGVASTLALTVEPTLVTKIEAMTDMDNSKKIYVGDKLTITALISPENATDKTTLFSSSDESIARVTGKGIVTAAGVGNAIITVSSPDGPKTTVPITISPSPQKFRINWSTSLASNDHVGNNWSYAFYVNNEQNGNSIVLDPESSFTVEFYVKDNDSNPDVGIYREEIKYSDDLCKNGYTISTTVPVREDGGRYAGHYAIWNLQITVTPIK